MVDATLRVQSNEELTLHTDGFDADKEDPWVTIHVDSNIGSSVKLRFESHPSSLHFLDALRFQLEKVSAYLRSGTPIKGR